MDKGCVFYIMKSISISFNCPTCSKSGTLTLNENKIRNSDRGITSINIEKGTTCKHSYIVYIDRNLAVRDIISADFTIVLPDAGYNSVIFPDVNTDNIDLYLLLINLHIQTFPIILRCTFTRKKLLILADANLLENYLELFLDFIFKDTFKHHVTTLNKREYIKHKKNYNNYIVIERGKIIEDKYNLIKEKPLKIEGSIIQKAMKEVTDKASLIILRNEMQKAFNLSKEIINFNNNLGKGEEYTSRKLLDHFMGNLDIKISHDYLDFLIIIVENYFSSKIIQKSVTTNFFGF